MVRVAGFEPTASWTRTKRDTKLRHTRMNFWAFKGTAHRTCPVTAATLSAPEHYKGFPAGCQGKNRA